MEKKGMKCEHMYFSIIPKDNKEEVEEVLAEVTNMLGEFFDIALDNIPNRLHTMRKMSYEMNLVPGASFPNKAVHRMTLAKSEELNRQVHELL